MYNARPIAIFSIIAIIAFGILLIKKPFRRTTSSKKWTVGILQTASHPALNAARDGFIETLHKQLGDDVNCIIRNGEGSISTIYAIAQQFHAREDINAIYAIATPAAQAISSVEKEKPIIIAAVSVSPELGISFDQPNVCGVSDMIDVRAEVEAMHTLLPNVQTVGIVFSSAEVNSVATAKIMATALERVGYTPITVGIASESDIEPAVMSALRKVDALIAPTDNAVANTIALISDLARKAEKPLIVSDNMLVQYGPLMARGVDYYESGIQAGFIAVQLLKHNRKPYELPIVMPASEKVFINMHTLAALKLHIPASLAAHVVPIEMAE